MKKFEERREAMALFNKAYEALYYCHTSNKFSQSNMPHSLLAQKLVNKLLPEYKNYCNTSNGSFNDYKLAGSFAELANQNVLKLRMALHITLSTMARRLCDLDEALGATTPQYVRAYVDLPYDISIDLMKTQDLSNNLRDIFGRNNKQLDELNISKLTHYNHQPVTAQDTPALYAVK